MRFAPTAAALSLALAISASTLFAAPRQPDPRAAALLAQGEAALRSGNAQAAADAFESALALDPAHAPTLLRLAEAARASELPGKAIRFYRLAQARDPGNLEALAGEGAALAEKGALEKAKLKLAAVQKACGKATCPPAQALSAAIAKGPSIRVQTAEAVVPNAKPAQAN